MACINMSYGRHAMCTVFFAISVDEALITGPGS